MVVAYLPLGIRNIDQIWRKIDSIFSLVRRSRSQVSVQYASQIINLLLEVGVLNDANEVLDCLQVLLILFALLYYWFQLLLEELLQFLEDVLLLSGHRVRPRWAIDLIGVLVVSIHCLHRIIAFVLDALDPPHDLIDILFDELGRIFDVVYLLSTLRE